MDLRHDHSYICAPPIVLHSVRQSVPKRKAWQLLKTQSIPSMPFETRTQQRVVEHAELDDIRIASGCGLGDGGRESTPATERPVR